MARSKAHVEHVLSHTPLQGYWLHRVWDRSGSLVDPGKWKRNLIVSKVGSLLAWFMHGGVGAPSGIQYYALGSGLTSWDAAPAYPAATDTQLETELVDGGGLATSRKVPTITYLDASLAVVAGPTNILNLSVIYDYNELNSNTPPAQNVWREFGVFGGDASATTPNSGYMINHVVTGAFTKTAQLKVQRTVRFTF